MSITAAVSSRRETGAGLVEQQHARLAQQRHRTARGSAARHATAAPPCARRRRGTDSATAARRASGSSSGGGAAEQVEPPGAAAPQRDARDCRRSRARANTTGIWNLRATPRRDDPMGRQPVDRAAVEASPRRPAPAARRSAVERRGLAGAVRADHAEDRRARSNSSDSRSRIVTSPTSHARRRRARGAPAARAAARARRSRRRRCARRSPSQRSSGAKTPISPAGKTSTTTMKKIAIAISQNGKLSRNSLVSEPTSERADDRAEQPRAAADRGPDHEVGREPEADTSCGVTSPCCGA